MSKDGRHVFTLSFVLAKIGVPPSCFGSVIWTLCSGDQGLLKLLKMAETIFGKKFDPFLVLLANIEREGFILGTANRGRERRFCFTF